METKTLSRGLIPLLTHLTATCQPEWRDSSCEPRAVHICMLKDPGQRPVFAALVAEYDTKLTERDAMGYVRLDLRVDGVPLSVSFDAEQVLDGVQR